MEKHHSILFEYEILLAINFIGQEEKDDIIRRVTSKISSEQDPEKAVEKPIESL